jgi:hypothetical protein
MGKKGSQNDKKKAKRPDDGPRDVEDEVEDADTGDDEVLERTPVLADPPVDIDDVIASLLDVGTGARVGGDTVEHLDVERDDQEGPEPDEQPLARTPVLETPVDSDTVDDVIASLLGGPTSMNGTSPTANMPWHEELWDDDSVLEEPDAGLDEPEGGEASPTSDQGTGASESVDDVIKSLLDGIGDGPQPGRQDEPAEPTNP